MHSTELKGKVAIVTGAGQGLGEALCEMLAQNGAIIAACDIKEDQVNAVAERLNAAGGQASAFVVDVANETAVAHTINAIVTQFEHIDILINNAGVDVTKPLQDMSIQEWDRVINVNLRGPFLLSKAVYPHLTQQAHGHIVNITSTAAKRAWTEASAYHASKWGLLGFSHALHAEARHHNVKVTAVIAGGMRTPFITERFPNVNSHTLQDPKNVANTVRHILTQPAETVIPEVMVLPLKETSWP